MSTAVENIEPNYADNCDADLVVGYMIEGRYSWNEFCMKHACLFLDAYPDRQYRTICPPELLVAAHEYRCYACNKKLES